MYVCVCKQRQIETEANREGDTERGRDRSEIQTYLGGSSGESQDRGSSGDGDYSCTEKGRGVSVHMIWENNPVYMESML